MTGWGRDDIANADWQDYAAQLRGELAEPPPTLRFRVWHGFLRYSRWLPMPVRATIANFLASVGREWKIRRRPDGRVAIPLALEMVLDTVISLVLSIAIVYALFVVAPQWIALARARGDLP